MQKLWLAVAVAAVITQVPSMVESIRVQKCFWDRHEVLLKRHKNNKGDAGQARAVAYCNGGYY